MSKHTKAVMVVMNDDGEANITVYDPLYGGQSKTVGGWGLNGGESSKEYPQPHQMASSPWPTYFDSSYEYGQ